MRELMTTFLTVVLLLLTGVSGEATFDREIRLNQLSFLQGQVLVIKVGGSELPEGTLMGKEIKFQPYQNSWIALYGISYWIESGVYPLKIHFGSEDMTQYITITKANFAESHLIVSPEQQKLVQPTPDDQEIIKRKEQDQLRVTQAYQHGEPLPLWSKPFIRPTEGQVTTGYGFTRYVNGKLNNRHSGLDIANFKGTPIYAANKGVVRLAEELLVTGKTTIIDHGGGLYSSYSHQSEIIVSVGDVVERGQLIGKMGSTGFSTGSHLHWVMKIGDAYLNPDYFVGTDLLRDVNILIPEEGS